MARFVVILSIEAESQADAEDAAAGIADSAEAIILNVQEDSND